MKKILLLLSLPTAFSISMSAQAIPNAGMENWTANSGYDDPNGWGTFNVLSNAILGGNPVSVFKDNVNPHSGTYSAKITSVALTSNPASGTIPDTVGIAWTGGVNFVSQSATFGYASTQRPSTFSWWDHYTAMSSGDSGFVWVALTHWNGSSTDTLAFAGQTIMNAANWTNYTANFFYNPLFPNTIFPDTAIIIASATDDNFPRPGSTLWIDDMSFAGWVGVNEFANENSVSVYPNPSSSTTNFEMTDENANQIVVYDMTGRQVNATMVLNKKATIESSTLASGIYNYSIINKEGEVLSRGKFTVGE